MTRRLILLTLVSAGCLSTSGSGIAPVESESFIFYEQDVDQMAWYQHQFDVLSASFGFALPTQTKIILSGFSGTLPDGNVLSSDCESGYCRLGNNLALVCRFQPNNRPCEPRLGALYADLIGTTAPLVLRAGFAEVIAGGSAIPDAETPNSDRSIDLSALLDDGLFAATQNPTIVATAADFTRYLIDKVGASAFASIYASLDFTALEQAIAEWKQTPAYTGRQYAWNEPECSSAPLDHPTATEWTGVVSLSPSAIYLTGAAARNDRWVKATTFQLASPQDVVVEIAGESGPYISIERCNNSTRTAPLATPIVIVPTTQKYLGGIEGQPQRQINGTLAAGSYVAFVIGGGGDANIKIAASP
jgi:hypothetical protein